MKEQTKVEKEGIDVMQQIQNLRAMTAEDLTALGLGQIAYLRQVTLDGHRVWAVFAANGQQVAVMPTYEAAWTAIYQNDLELVALN